MCTAGGAVARAAGQSRGPSVRLALPPSPPPQEGDLTSVWLQLTVGSVHEPETWPLETEGKTAQDRTDVLSLGGQAGLAWRPRGQSEPVCTAVGARGAPSPADSRRLSLVLPTRRRPAGRRHPHRQPPEPQPGRARLEAARWDEPHHRRPQRGNLGGQGGEGPLGSATRHAASGACSAVRAVALGRGQLHPRPEAAALLVVHFTDLLEVPTLPLRCLHVLTRATHWWPRGCPGRPRLHVQDVSWGPGCWDHPHQHKFLSRWIKTSSLGSCISVTTKPPRRSSRP